MSEERTPLLSDGDMWMSTPIEAAYIDVNGKMAYRMGVQKHPIMSSSMVRDFYENLITIGELMVVKTCKFVTNNYDANIDCDGCGWSICYIHVEDNPMKFCPGCGRKIVDQ